MDAPCLDGAVIRAGALACKEVGLWEKPGLWYVSAVLMRGTMPLSDPGLWTVIRDHPLPFRAVKDHGCDPPRVCSSFADYLRRDGDWTDETAMRITAIYREFLYLKGLCCTNPARDSSRESSVIAGGHEQIEHIDLQDPELARI